MITNKTLIVFKTPQHPYYRPRLVYL